MATANPLGWFGAFFRTSPLLALLPVGFALLLVRIAWSERRTWGLELSAWAATYPVFVMMVTAPMTGFLRYLMLAFPFGLAWVGRPHQSTRTRVAWIAAGCLVMLAAQVLWVRYFWVIDLTGGRFPIMP